MRQPGAPLPGPNPTRHRLRTLAWFLLALLFALFAQQFSDRTAGLLLPGLFYEAGSRVIYCLLLLLGFAAMGALGQGQRDPFGRMGLARRPGMTGEWLLGIKIGWGGIVACVLPVALIGGLYVTVTDTGFSPYAALLLDLITLLIATLADELVFRGYPFQRLIEVVGPGLASVLMALLFAMGYYSASAESAGGTLNTILLGLLLAMAYLRTRALWVCWGLHFAWVASMALLFGLPAAGLTTVTPVRSTYTVGPAWLTGGGYGPEDSGLATIVLLVLMVVLARSTRDLRHRWAQPVIIGAGIPVDIDALSQRQHERGMGPAVPAAAASSLVQIAPAPTQEP